MTDFGIDVVRIKFGWNVAQENVLNIVKRFRWVSDLSSLSRRWSGLTPRVARSLVPANKTTSEQVTPF